MKKSIIAISLFGPEIEDSGNTRITNILKYLNSSDNNVKYITSDFIHSKKCYRKVNFKANNTTYIHVPSYKHNISFNRIFSHIIFAIKLKRYLNNLTEKPNTIYCAMPTSTAAFVAGNYCRKHNIKFVIDVIDLWPDSLFPLTSYKKIISFITSPWKWITIQAYKKANTILGESKAYAYEASKYNPNVPIYPFYLGVDFEKVQAILNKNNLEIRKTEEEIWIAYGGSLGRSYDFETLIKSVSVLNNKYHYKLFFIGDGDARHKIESLIEKYSVNAEITGFVTYDNFLKYLSYCDIAVNIFKENTKVVHSYKFNDYVATQCFILNSLNGETAEMINEFQIGMNFDFKNNTLDKILINCVANWDEYKNWKKNNIRLINDVLDNRMIYSKIRDILIE